jgi:tRNA (guanine-N7-)-methyltransferase
MSEPDDEHPIRAGAFFGRRKGHPLRSRQAGLFESLLPRLSIDCSGPAPTDLRVLFAPRVNAVHLEIGFGGGEHLVSEAARHPAVGFIGCEPFVNGMAKALAAIDALQLQNVRLHHADATELLDWLPAAGLARIDLLYPDPWPKRRHWKRRFVSDAMVAKAARLLEPGGEFHFASDWSGYAEWTLLRFLRSPRFEWTAERADDWRQPWPGFEPTRYEQKAVREGRRSSYLTFRRV